VRPPIRKSKPACSVEPLGFSGNSEYGDLQKSAMRRFRYFLKGEAVRLEYERQERGHVEPDGEWVPMRLDEPRAISGRIKCRRVRHTFDSGVQIIPTRGGGVGLAGVGRCNSIAECPVCAAMQAMKRREQVDRAVKAVEDRGGLGYLVTFTVRHRATDDLKILRKALTSSYRAIWQNRVGKLAMVRFGVVGTIRSLEITHGSNGFHPHLHIALMVSKPLGRYRRDNLRIWLQERWAKVVKKNGLGEVVQVIGVKISEIKREFKDGRRMSYLTKMGLGDEVGNTMRKDGRAGSRSMFQVLHDCAKARQGIERSCSDGERARWRQKHKKDAAVWGWYCKGARGARWLTYGKGLIDKREPPTQLDFDPRLPFSICETTWDAICNGWQSPAVGYDNVFKLVDAYQFGGNVDAVADSLYDDAVRNTTIAKASPGL
jgi:hypothetical protein